MPQFVSAGKERRFLVDGLRRIDAVGVAPQNDGRHRDPGLAGQQLFKRVEHGIARDEAEAMTVGMDDDVDEIGVVKCFGGAREGRVVEVPKWRPVPSEQATQGIAVRHQPAPATLAV